MDARSKIAKLLRLARDRDGEPEGDNARRFAEKLMAEHGIEVTDEDLDEDAGPAVDQDWVVEASEPVPWMEMLLVALCDILYGGVVLPMVGPGGWRLYVVADKGSVDVDALAYHFAYLQHHIEALTVDFEELYNQTRTFSASDRVLTSFSLGLVYGITEMLFEDIEGILPKEEQMPFMYGKALAPGEAQDEPQALAGMADESGPHHDSFKQQLEASNEVFQHITEGDRKDEVEIRPDWHIFEQGRQAAHDHVDSVVPPESEGQVG